MDGGIERHLLYYLFPRSRTRVYVDVIPISTELVDSSPVLLKMDVDSSRSRTPMFLIVAYSDSLSEAIMGIVALGMMKAVMPSNRKKA